MKKGSENLKFDFQIFPSIFKKLFRATPYCKLTALFCRLPLLTLFY